MAVQKQDDQHEQTFSSYVRIRGVVLKTYLGRWTIGRSGEKGQGYPCYQRDMMMMMMMMNCLQINDQYLIGLLVLGWNIWL